MTVLSRPKQRQAADHKVLSPRQPIQVSASIRLALRLSQHLAVDDHLCVSRDHQSVAALWRNRLSFASRVAHHELAGLPRGLFLYLRDAHLEVQPEGREQGAPLGRPRGENQSSGNQIPISRSADSGESEPWTRLKVTSVANSPRMDPASASSGSVAPIT